MISIVVVVDSLLIVTVVVVWVRGLQNTLAFFYTSLLRGVGAANDPERLHGKRDLSEHMQYVLKSQVLANIFIHVLFESQRPSV